MRKLLFLCLLIAARSAHAQTQTYSTITGSHLTDGSGNPVASAKLCFSPVDNSGNSIGVRAAGQVSLKPVCSAVVNGAFSIQLVNTIGTSVSPQNFCYATTMTDNTHAGAQLLPKTGYQCVQQSSSWCSASGGNYNCDFDNYIPASSPQTAVVAPSIAVGTVTTLPTGTPATATISGAQPFNLNLGLPTGATGLQGATGPAGASTGTTYGTTFSPAAANNVGLAVIGDSIPCGGTGIATSACINSGLPNAGILGNQDVISQLLLQSQFYNRTAYYYNGSYGGTTCADTNGTYQQYMTGGARTYNPVNGANKGNATKAYLVIMDGGNDATAYAAASLTPTQATSAFAGCMSTLVNQAQADGFTVIITTDQYQQNDTDYVWSIKKAMNRWKRTLIRQGVFLWDQATLTPPSTDSSEAGGVLGVMTCSSGYTTATTGTAPGQTTSLSCTSSASNTHIANGTLVQIGGASDQSSAPLNGIYGTLTSGSGSTSQVISLQNVAPSALQSVTSTDTIYIWQNSFDYSGSTPYTARHYTYDGNLYLAVTLNSQLQAGYVGSPNFADGDWDYVQPNSGAIEIAGGLCVEGNTTTGAATRCPGNPTAPGVIESSQTLNAGSEGGANYTPGTGRFDLGAVNHGIRQTVGSQQWVGANLGSPLGRLSTVTVNNGGTGCAVGDVLSLPTTGINGTITVLTCSGSAVATVSIATVGHGYNPYATGVSTSCSQTTGWAATVSCTGTETGLTLNYTTNSNNSTLAWTPFYFEGGGFGVYGGSLTACALPSYNGSTNCRQDSSGLIYSYSGGPITALTVGPDGGSGYTVGNVLSIVPASNLNYINMGSGTCTIATLGPNNSVASCTLTTGGYGYVAGVTYNASGGSGTGATLTVGTVGTYNAGGIKMGDDADYIYNKGGVMGIFSGNAFTFNNSINVTGYGAFSTYVSAEFFAGLGAATFATGAAAGTGATASCLTTTTPNHYCTSVNGTVSLTTGTSPTTGTLMTVTLPYTRSGSADCNLSMMSSTGLVTSYTWAETASTIVITATTALSTSTNYLVKYVCGGK